MIPRKRYGSKNTDQGVYLGLSKTQVLSPATAGSSSSDIAPLPPPVCASPACLPGHCQRTLSRKACPITEFPCLNRSVCLPPTEKWSSLAHAHSLSPVSISPPPQDPLHSALSSPVPCLLLCLLRGSFCFRLLPSFWSDSCRSF